jgi:hypothetical protein
MKIGGLVLVCLAAPLPGQQLDSAVARPSPILVRYGKWATLGAAVGMGLKAASAHRAADRAYGRLEHYCLTDPPACDQGPGGAYLDPVAERYYQASLGHDRRARRWLFGGEVTLLATAGIFVWELTRPRGPPDNIPFSPSLSVSDGNTRLGLALAF